MLNENCSNFGQKQKYLASIVEHNGKIVCFTGFVLYGNYASYSIEKVTNRKDVVESQSRDTYQKKMPNFFKSQLYILCPSFG